MFAIDLTIMNDMDDLDMGTEFDDFSPKSHQGCLSINDKAQKKQNVVSWHYA